MTRAMCCPLRVLFLLAALMLSHQLSFVSAQDSPAASPWQTLAGDPPLVVARGGYSGLVPDSSFIAYQMAQVTSVPDVVFWCDVQLSKDGAGICFPNINLANSSAIDKLKGTKKSTYDVNGESVTGYFSIDYTMDQLANVPLLQGIYSRPPYFDASNTTGTIVTPELVFDQLRPAGFWLNVQHDAFYSQHNLSMRSYILGAMKSVIIDYLSSPELGFLQGIAPRFAATKTKLIFRFMGTDEVEPTSNQTYGSLLNNLTMITGFAAGILVPKSYIWPVDDSLYLLPATTLVQDAHKAGLLVFASDFANDNVIAYNYSYNPVEEYLSFIDNGDFSVDGVLTDFPSTPSEAIDCFAHLGKDATAQAKPLVVSHDGASGDYPSCTGLAYTKAISDGADVIDCNVQVSKDGVPFCLMTINLLDSTNVVDTEYLTRSENIPELQSADGVFTFKLTWEEIQGLTPAISSPYNKKYKLLRNPKFKNAGKLVSLAEFLSTAKKSSSLSGVLIKIEHAAYLVEKQGLSVTDAVQTALDKSGYSNQTAQKLMIQSTNSAVLKYFKGERYELVYQIDETIRDVKDSTAAEIKSLASAVVLNKDSIFPTEQSFVVTQTDVVQKLQALNLTVLAQVFMNEFLSQPYDFFSDPIAELNNFVQGAGVDGVVTEFPLSAVSYRKNRCLTMGKTTPPYMMPVQPGGLFQLMSPTYLPPAEAPAPILSDVSEPPLPDEKQTPAPSPKTSPSSKGTSNGLRIEATCALVSAMVVMAISTLVLF